MGINLIASTISFARSLKFQETCFVHFRI